MDYFTHKEVVCDHGEPRKKKTGALTFHYPWDPCMVYIYLHLPYKSTIHVGEYIYNTWIVWVILVVKWPDPYVMVYCDLHIPEQAFIPYLNSQGGIFSLLRLSLGIFLWKISQTFTPQEFNNINRYPKSTMIGFLGGWTPTHLKNLLVKVDHFPRDHFPRDRGGKKYVKPPPRFFSNMLSMLLFRRGSFSQ